MEPTPHIMVVDDHRDIRDLIARFLRKHELRVTTAADAAEARRALKAAAPDLVVLDVMMPGEDGLSLARHVRETIDVPIIFLTALGEETDRIVGLEMGADDYLGKPFNPRELLARIRAVLRRAQSLPVQREPAPTDAYRFGPWRFFAERRELLDEADTITPLSHGEFLLLTVMLQRPNIVLSRDQLLDLTKGRAAQLFDRSIDNQISRLRRKIEADPKLPRYIQTVWGGGYKFVGPVEKL